MKITGIGSTQDFQTSPHGETKSASGSFEEALNEQVSLSATGVAHMTPSVESGQTPIRVVSSQAATVLDQKEISFFESMLNPMTSRYGKESMYSAQAQPRSAARLNRIA